MRRASQASDSGTLAVVVAVAFGFIALPVPAPAATPASSAAGLAATGAAMAPVAASTDGSFPVTLTLTTRLAGLRPEVATGAWVCSARAMTKSAIDAEIAKIGALSAAAAFDEFHAGLGYRAHYLGQQASVEFPVAGGGYTGTLSVTIKVGGADLVDPATQRLIADPGVMVGCWLRLLDARGQGDFALQSPASAASTSKVEAMRHVSMRPFVLVSASVTGA